MPSRKRYFEDLAIGEIAESSTLTVTREEMLAFARVYDPQYFHTDPDAAKASVFGEVIASGIYTAALWRRQDALICGDIAWICGIAWEDVRWPIAVRAGDTLRARAEVLQSRLSDSAPDRGVVTMLYTLVNQHDAVVFTCRSINLIERRPRAS